MLVAAPISWSIFIFFPALRWAREDRISRKRERWREREREGERERGREGESESGREGGREGE